MAIRRAQQIRNRGVRFAKGATGPYARKLGPKTQARACVRPNAAFDCLTGNVVPNGCFDEGTLFWNGNNATVSIVETDNLQLSKNASGTEGNANNFDIVISNGSTYRIQARYRCTTADSCRVTFSGGLSRNDPVDNAVSGGEWREVDYQLTATQPTFTCFLRAFTADGVAGIAVFDYVKVSLI